MNTHSLRSLAAALMALTITHCSSGVSSESTATVASTGAGVAAVFSGFSLSASESVDNLIRHLDSTQEICNSLERAPGKVIMIGRGNGTATYGAAGDEITVTETDYCENSSGVANTGTAADGAPLFAYFIFLDEIAGNCSESGTTVSMSMTKGTGIVRSTDDHTPEIYGQFEINGDIVDCTLRLSSDGSLDSAASSCSDSNGDQIVLNASTSCTSMDADGGRIAVPTTFEGHFGVTQDQGQNVAYDCWVIYPYSVDADGFLDYTSDCTTFDSYGFNIEGFNVGAVVGGDETNWEIYYTTDFTQLANRVKITHNAGYPVVLSFDVLYVEEYDGTNDEVIQDSAELPQDIIDQAIFQDTLLDKILEVAELSERLDVEIFVPLSESDRVFNMSTATNADSVFLQNHLSAIESVYTGKLMWMAQFFDSTSTSTYNLTGFDYAGVNISPGPSQTPNDFITHVQTQLSNMRSVANSFGIPYLITNAGIWGEALNNTTFDWDLSEDRVLTAFTTMQDQSVAYGTSGIIFWEGAAGEVVFEDYSTLRTYIINEFH